MSSESRAIAAFTGVGVLLVAVAIAVARFGPERGGVAELPPVPATTTAATPPVLPTRPPPVIPGRRLFCCSTRASRATQIAFAYAGEIWIVARDGGEARRLVTGQLRNYRPIFSPDGSQIAFTGDATTATPTCTSCPPPAASPGASRTTRVRTTAVGWTPDGTRVLFQSWRATPRDLPKLFTVPTDGGLPEELPAALGGPRPATRPTASASRTSRSTSGSPSGSSTAAGRRRPSGSPICPTRTS